MGDNNNSNNEQRQYSGGSGGGATNANVVSRKKASNDLSASPKYVKVGSRGNGKGTQQQKQHRNNYNNREQRGTGGSKYRERGVLERSVSQRDESNDYFDHVGGDEENLGSFDDFDHHHPLERQVSGGGSAKKTNVSHMLNFHFRDKQRVNVRGNRRSSDQGFYAHGKWSSSSGSSGYRQHFSKEQFLQANCQFVVQTGLGDYSLQFADPDLAIDWSRVEQVRFHSMQPLKCPICLSEPLAGKITLCGHVYCWSCLLHYLALSDKSWRKCPVCSEPIYKQDIRSVRSIVSRPFKPGDSIIFRLMCRERGSVLFHPRASFTPHAFNPEPERLLLQSNPNKQHAHLLSADDETILNEIIEREKLDLLKQLQEDGDQPEACFIKQALEENNAREKLLVERLEKVKTIHPVTLKQQKEEEIPQPSPPAKAAVVYKDAFDDIVGNLEEEEEENKAEEEEESHVDTVPEKHQLPVVPQIQQQHRHYFYQADNVHHAYLNGLNTRILIHEYGSYQQCPDELHVRVEAIESFFMTEDLRAQFRFLSHLPLTCEFQVIEIRLHPPLISPATMQLFADEIHRRRQFRTRKERLEKRRQQQAEVVESQKLFSQYPAELMYIPQEQFPVNGTNSMEEFPAMITSASPPSAAISLPDENLLPSSPPTGVSFAQMLKQQARPQTTNTTVTKKPSVPAVPTVEILGKNLQNKKKKKKKGDVDSDDDNGQADDDYYAPVPNFHASFSLEAVFDRLKLVNGEEHPVTSLDETASSGAHTTTTKKKNKKTKQVLFATGMGGQAKL